jgi:hypothetical protein
VVALDSMGMLGSVYLGSILVYHSLHMILQQMGLQATGAHVPKESGLCE